MEQGSRSRSAAAGSSTSGARETAAFPAAFVRRMGTLLGPELDAFLASLADPEPGLRVNTLRLSPARFRELAPFGLEPTPLAPEGFVVDPAERPGLHAYHAAGLYYLQDPSAMMVAPLLAAAPGERVIDLAAAPGGKATHLAAMLAGSGVLIANDPHAGRARELAGNLERCGVRNAAITAESVERLAARFGACFDRVLLDAPCSGEAMFHKSEAARAGWSEAAVAGCARRQDDLIAAAADLVRPGGRLVYATCTFSPDEDEAVVARFLDRRPDFRIAPPPAVSGAAPGRPDWLQPAAARPELARAVRLWPHRVPGAGHFLAALDRDPVEAPAPLFHAPETPPSEVRRFWNRFVEEHLVRDVVAGFELELRGEALYAVAAATPPLSGLRVLRPGWWIATVHRNRVEPAHALALGISPAEARASLDLTPDEPRLAAYLRGETIRDEGDDGWTLVCVDGFPVGWGKRVRGQLKNHYPKGLRRFR